MVGDLADGTGYVSGCDVRERVKAAHETSAKVEGRSTIRAPPKRGVLVYEAILEV